jgi:formylglycine-generating enzyme required for sulfatase activity
MPDQAVELQRHLRELLIEHFSKEELNTMCADLGCDYETLPGEDKESRAREIVTYFNRQDQLPDVIDWCHRRRPNLSDKLNGLRKQFGASAASPSPGPRETNDRTGKPRKVSDIVWVSILLLMVVMLWPTIQNAIAPTPRPTAEVLEFKLSTRATPTLGIDSTRVSEKDGMEMVYVPAGEFLMGSTDSDTSASSDEKPQHRVYLDAFWIDRTEVTNEMFEKFVADSGHKTDAEKAGKGRVLDLASKIGIGKETAGANWREPRGPGSYTGLDQHPVVQVSWDDAKAYCEWAERRLPTEAEWEKAARGTDSLKFPWRNQNIAGDLLNFADRKLKEASWADTSVDDGYKFTAPVGSYPKGASPYRARDMAGNVWEWVADWYGEKYYTSSAAQSPTGPALGQERVMRGGSWDDPQVKVRAAKRLGHIPDFSGADVGFRCAYPP